MTGAADGTADSSAPYPPGVEELREAAGRLGPSRLRTLAELIERGEPRVLIAAAVPRAEAATVTAAMAGRPPGEAAAYLRGVADGLQHPGIRVEPVWSGPTVHGVPVRATAQVLTELVRRAEHELFLSTYSARQHDGLRAALSSAVQRGVQTVVIVETLQGAGGAISGDEPALAFEGTGAQLWHWPPGLREKGAKMHAKLAVGDRRELFVSSANLTQSGVSQNMESGLLIRGGAAPERTAEHLRALKSAGVLQRLL